MNKIYLLILLVSINTWAQCWETASAGYTHSLAIKTDGTLWAWGDNAFGQLGIGTTTHRNVPTRVGTGTDWLRVAAGNWYSLGIKSNGTLWAWGYNTFGQLGIGSTSNRTTPTQVGTATDWVAISAGYNHTLAIRANGTLWAWGSNNAGALGIGSTVDQINVPTQVGTATNWSKVAAGQFFSLGFRTNGIMWGWGSNLSSQLGGGFSADFISSPIQTADDLGTYWLDISAGNNHVIGIDISGSPFVWGSDNLGQLGTGNIPNTGLPWAIGLLEEVEGIEAGVDHTFIIMASGKIFGAGQNNFGQLGNGTTTSATSFTTIGTATDHEKISAGGSHTLSIRTDGSLTACGKNDRGQLGDGTNIQRNQFTSITCPTTLAVEDFTTSSSKLKAYPNPVNNILTLSYDRKITSVAIYNLLGQEVLRKNIDANEGSIDISIVPSGTYFVKALADHQVLTIKVIKE